jgi:hypothetical protein
MSGLVKGAKKVFKSIGKGVKKVASKVAKGVRTFVKSKVFKYIVIAAAIYFGGAGLASMSQGTGFWAGVSNAGTQLGGAFTSIGQGQFAQAGTQLSQGFTASNLSTAGSSLSQVGGALADAQKMQAVGGGASNVSQASNIIKGAEGFTQAQVGANGLTANVSSGIASNSANAGLMNAGGVSSVNQASNVIANADNYTKAKGIVDTSNATNLGLGAETGMSAGEGLMWSAGINSGMQAAGGYLNARSAQEEEKRNRDRRINNMRNKTYDPNYGYQIVSAFTPKTPKTITDLIGG